MDLLKYNSQRSLNEIVFEDRNKAYGAYAIRRSYDDNMIKGLLFTSLLLMAFILFAKLLRSEELIVPRTDTPNDPPITQTKIYEIDITPKKKDLVADKPKTKTAPPASPKKNLGWMVSNKEDEKKEDEKKEEVKEDERKDDLGAGNENKTGDEKGGITEGGTQGNSGGDAGNQEVQLVTAFAPEFPGGEAKLMEYLNTHIKYPRRAFNNGTSGVVYLRFVVNEEGDVEKVEIIKGLGDGCDAAAIDVVKSMPRWKPGRNELDKPVKVWFNLPIAFRLR